ncbi:MAG: UbiX family flavin prenyltransferase [Desulfurococcaceae archaeon]
MSPRRVDCKRSLIIALTGASGIALGLWFLKHVSILKSYYECIYATYTEGAMKVARIEESVDLQHYLRSLDVDAVYFENDLEAPIASSSRLVHSDMVIVPASLNTTGKIANGIQDNLVTRAAGSILRLGGKLVVVVRETPLSPIDLRNLYRLSRAGAIILPATIAMYPRPKGIEDILDFITGKILDVLGIAHSLYDRWAST